SVKDDGANWKEYRSETPGGMPGLHVAMSTMDFGTAHMDATSPVGFSLGGDCIMNPGYWMKHVVQDWLAHGGGARRRGRSIEPVGRSACSRAPPVGRSRAGGTAFR